MEHKSRLVVYDEGEFIRVNVLNNEYNTELFMMPPLIFISCSS